MFFHEVFVSQMNAQEVANIVAAFIRGEHEGEHFKLIVLNKDESERRELWVRPVSGTSLSPVASADQIKCMSDDGREISLIIPSADRRTSVALVVIGDQRSSDRTAP